MQVEITEAEAQELDLSDFYTVGDTFDFKGHTYTYVETLDHVDEHRWNYTNWFIFKRDDGKLFAHPFDYGNTESQENGYVYSNCELFEVEAYTKTVTDYKVVKVENK